jgi:hypothetical protein
MNCICGSWFAGAVSVLLPCFLNAFYSQPGRSQSSPEKEFVCYVQLGNQRVINLTNLCGVGESNQLSVMDQRFLHDYQRSLKARSRPSPQVQAALLEVEQNPQTIVQQAKNVCTKIQNGMLQAPISQPNRMDSVLVNQLALEHYCPDLND